MDLFKLVLFLIVLIALLPAYAHDNFALNEIQKIMKKPLYQKAKWGIRVIDVKTNKVWVDMNSNEKFYIGSVRKLFSVGELLNEVGADHRSVTTVQYDGKINKGELKGNLILVASGDLSMGGRTKPDGQIALTDFDHNEADSLGNAQITHTDPLAGYKQLARQVKKSGIHKIMGDVIIDDRLFEPFYFRQEFYVSPIFVNDDVIDIIINPGEIGQKALVKWQPHSTAFTVINNLKTVKAHFPYSLALNPRIPECFGSYNCKGEITNNLPIDFVPPLTQSYPLIQTFRIAKPASYARIVFIEALRDAEIDVSGITLIKNNPRDKLKSSPFYDRKKTLASLNSLPYADYAKYILKVSYNIGADTSLVLFGLTQGVKNMQNSLQVEKEILEKKYGINQSQFKFVDGSGGGETTATNKAVTDWLQMMAKSHSFKAFFAALPILNVDGSMVFVNKFAMNPSLRGAKGKVFVKPGSYVVNEKHYLLVKGQALAGYIQTKNHRLMAFQIVVNNVPVNSIDGLLDIFQDQGTITALLWQAF